MEGRRTWRIYKKGIKWSEKKSKTTEVKIMRNKRVEKEGHNQRERREGK